MLSLHVLPSQPQHYNFMLVLMAKFLSGIYLMASNTWSGDCTIEAYLYRNENMVGVWSDGWITATGVAVTECEEGETLRVRTNENTCHDIWNDPDDVRVSWFSVVLIAMT